jgi:hypothetical protein
MLRLPRCCEPSRRGEDVNWSRGTVPSDLAFINSRRAYVVKRNQGFLLSLNHFGIIRKKAIIALVRFDDLVRDTELNIVLIRSKTNFFQG